MATHNLEDLQAAYREVTVLYGRTLQQRDELLAALKEAVAWAAPMEEAPVKSRPLWFDISRALIAKAEQS